MAAAGVIVTTTPRRGEWIPRAVGASGSQRSHPAHHPRGIVANRTARRWPRCRAEAVCTSRPDCDPIAVATVQAVSGAGREASTNFSNQLEKSHGKRRARPHLRRSAFPLDSGVKFPATIAHNVIPMAGRFLTTAHSRPARRRSSATKVERSSRFPVCSLTRRCVRVPVFTGHSLAITASFERPLSPEEAAELLETATGVVVCELPMPRLAPGKDPCTWAGFVAPRRS